MINVGGDRSAVLNSSPMRERLYWIGCWRGWLCFCFALLLFLAPFFFTLLEFSEVRCELLFTC